MTRAQKLYDVAVKTAKRRLPTASLYEQNILAEGFERGYRQALQDARKVRKGSKTFIRHDTQLWCIDQWLKPLR